MVGAVVVGLVVVVGAVVVGLVVVIAPDCVVEVDEADEGLVELVDEGFVVEVDEGFVVVVDAGSLVIGVVVVGSVVPVATTPEVVSLLSLILGRTLSTT